MIHRGLSRRQTIPSREYAATLVTIELSRHDATGQEAVCEVPCSASAFRTASTIDAPSREAHQSRGICRWQGSGPSVARMSWERGRSRADRGLAAFRPKQQGDGK